MSKASDLASLEVGVARIHVIATRIVLLLAICKPHCHNTLDLSLWLSLSCILEAWNTIAFEGYVHSALSTSINVV